eukprot:TRINITY_DN2110_c0_g1_i3.p1 TRINITY_DN2110_c0_g1~~TRINITY_DN2110_c0_g1_i3.p1  ORF type:complete len:439 (+),score=66.49 TRINITY_DN2110_c0_g1_i3:69-1385(+)
MFSRLARRCLSTDANRIGTAGLDWSNLGFDFRKTNGFVKYTWSEGKWDAGVVESEPYFNVHVMSSAIHYGQGLFEGTKAHACADGVPRLWNIGGNATRMQTGARRMMIPEVPEEMFLEACHRAVQENLEFLPPYGSGGSMYLRPILFGHGPQLGLQPAPQYTFAVLAMPVSSYYKGGGLNAVSVQVMEEYDRAAPLGVGNVKVSGNYGADILPSIQARAQGFPTVLYLDAKKKKFIEEFSVSNFIGIKYGQNGQKKYITPKSDTILMSCTNLMLMKLAPQMGYEVEHRPVELSELSSFDEVAGCGTAVVLMGVKDINMKNAKYSYESITHVEGLYNLFRSIQFGETQDIHNWGTPLRGFEHTETNYSPRPVRSVITDIRTRHLGEDVADILRKPLISSEPRKTTSKPKKHKSKKLSRRKLLELLRKKTIIPEQRVLRH